ncbi:phosphate/phosphite/phosphonate ABC transporter substrate-binding protein [Thermaerobacter sp. PB12/4term]|uniref:phosphate/phosphite/phosphonate ABC transporter substrate-binding protein n=1 Tax=Thermaerobacter sp. PB12/4term TaxID=2293838 RepID=UPI000E32A015|nr:phosphate/phosphite/phosphonate ABC transporter substrate-binding protein [Thermaerobacter sp. PB12/4term]QIA27862.1 phosphate/phosphite/phosphonate ABC transporter substrate-binding protein [Thermaerobacter sp. PB12/4term]
MPKRKAASILVALLLVAALVLSACGGGNQQAEEPKDPDKLVMGFVPSQNATTLQETAEPLGKMLSDELGIPVEVFVSTNFIGLVEAMANEQVHIGFLNPFAYVIAKDRGDPVEVMFKSVRHGNDSYRAQIFVRADSGIDDVQGLKGKKFAFVDPASTSGYLFAAHYLLKNGIDPEKDIEAIMAGSHDGAVLSVYNGQTDGGASFEDARTLLKDDYPDVMDKVKVIAYTDPIPNDTISVASWLSDDLKKRIHDAFAKIAQTEEGKKVLFDIYEIEGLTDAKDSDFDIIRNVAKDMGINLEELAD